MAIVRHEGTPDDPVKVAVPLDVLAIMFEGYNAAGDGGIDPFYNDEHNLVDGWLRLQGDLEERLWEERHRQQLVREGKLFS